MVNYEYWIKSVVGTCELIASEDAFRKVWVDGDHTITSIYCYDELYVQVFDDLFFDQNLREFASRIADEATTHALGCTSHPSSLPPKTLDNLTAISGDMPRLPLTSSESASRVTPRAAAASVMLKPKGSVHCRKTTSPGCGGTRQGVLNS